ncbi:hypothetical protein H5410_044937 [Solanum commersonii]|uniref:Uncharacterized protein n=1 Tax=Solanum commersonii TaxID=4109 RepID=A0A9J5XA23_SOLCO|nr:hypothetical protein H5410_044937 [Solanum commersonii]
MVSTPLITESCQNNTNCPSEADDETDSHGRKPLLLRNPTLKLDLAHANQSNLEFSSISISETVPLTWYEESIQEEFGMVFYSIYGPHTIRKGRDVAPKLPEFGVMGWTLGVQFTWSRGDNFVQASRIDRFLISTEWSDSFKDVKQSALPKVISDHKPILLECGD